MSIDKAISDMKCWAIPVLLLAILSGNLAIFITIDLVKIQEASRKPAPWYIMHPESRFVTRWDLFTGLALIFTALITPYELAFLEPELDALFYVNRLIDLAPRLEAVEQEHLAQRFLFRGTNTALSVSA